MPFTLQGRRAGRGVPEGRRGARAGAAEGPPLGRRHARLDLQRDADRGRAGAGRLTCGISKRSMAKAAHEVRDPGAQQRSRQVGPEALSRRALRGGARSRRIPTRSWCARRTCTSIEFGPSLRAVGPRRRRHEQHPGRGDDQARRAGVQRAGRQRQRGEGAGARRHADRGAQPRARAGISSSGSKNSADLDKTDRGRQEAVRRLRAAGPHAGRDRPGQDRQPGRRRRDPPRHERARLRPAHHGRGRLEPALAGEARRTRSTRC